MDTIVPVRIGRRQSSYDVAIGADSLRRAGAWAAGCLGSERGKVLVVSNRKVFGLYGDPVLKSLAGSGFSSHVHLIGDGERFKNLSTLQQLLTALSEARFTRTDAVVALGGGVVGDLAGFAASIYLRGIAFLQVPTTLLSMVDSSVGGKTGVNTSFGKNLIGSFYQPKGVLIDIGTLQTLPRRELTGGFCEAVKQGAVAGKSLLGRTGDFLKRYPVDRRFKNSFTDASFAVDLADLLAAHISFKADIVQNDETESPTARSGRSRKILNFGHTLAHALEKVTNYRYLRHGEAVGHGIRFAAELSKRLELIGQHEVDLLNDVGHRAGVLPAISDIDPLSLFEAFKYDKKQVGDSLQWVLLRGIGKPLIVPNSDIPASTIKSTLRYTIQN